jgi:hypothetical protein
MPFLQDRLAKAKSDRHNDLIVKFQQQKFTELHELPYEERERRAGEATRDFTAKLDDRDRKDR